MIKIFFLLIVLCLYVICFPQEDTLSDNQDAIEELLESSAETENETEIINLLEDLASDPINVNTASLNDLLRIPFISNITAIKIFNYRLRNGYIFSIPELLTISDINKEEILKSQQYLTVETRLKNYPEEIKELNKSYYQIDFRSRLNTAIDSPSTTDKNEYPGNNFKIYNRVRVNYSDKVRVGILTEKDAGEKNYTDFTTFYLCAENVGPVKKIIAGDFNIEFGQGLALWAPYGLSKSGNTVKSIFKSNKIIKPYLSTNENRFFRGTALTANYETLDLTVFYSSNKVDASIDTITNEILSLVETGYHRTTNELKKKKNITEKSFGSVLNYRLSNLASLDLLYYNTSFSKSFSYSYDGSSFNCYSASYKINLQNLILFGETSWNNTIATINNILFTLNENISACFSYRNYSKDYYNFFGFGFGENSGQTRNETGFYTGVNIKSKYGQINFYYDQFKFPFSSYSVVLPLTGSEFFIEYHNKPFKKTEFLVRYRNEKKQVTLKLNDSESLTDRLLQNVKFEFKYNFSKVLKLKTRFDYVHQFLRDLPNEDGYFLLQDVNIKPGNNLNFSTRVIIYDTDSYDTRLYEYENDLDGVLTSALLYGKGFRWYLLVKYEIIPSLKLSLKYREHFKLKENNITNSNYTLDNSISMQIEIKL